MTAAKKPVPVRTGQIWADKDPRSSGRHVRVVKTDSRHAFVERVVPAGNHFLPAGGRSSSSRVLYDHRGLRGYRLVTDVEDGT